jgi:hypothetical protein
MKVLYFTVEDINSGLFDSQVLNTIVGIKKANPDIDITVLVINQPWKYLKAKAKFEQIRNAGIGLIYLPFLPPLRWISSGSFYTNIYLSYFWAVLKIFVNFKKFKLVHCRNYVPALVIRKFGNLNFLFDVRSLYAFEYVQAGKIVFNSQNYMYWLENERKLIQDAASVSVVSKGMVPYLQKIVNRPVDYCPIISNYEIVYYDAQSRNMVRTSLGWNDCNIYVYSGSFGLYGLNKSYLARLIVRIIEKDSKARFLFLISNPLSDFQSFLHEYDFSEVLFYAKSVKFTELTAFLSAADIGIHALPEQLDSFTRLGTKVVEYWSAGLPVIINENIGEAALICRKFGLGKVISLEHEQDIALNNLDIENVLKLDRIEIIEKTRKIFSSSVVAEDYGEIYRRFEYL